MESVKTNTYEITDTNSISQERQKASCCKQTITEDSCAWRRNDSKHEPINLKICRFRSRLRISSLGNRQKQASCILLFSRLFIIEHFLTE